MTLTPLQIKIGAGLVGAIILLIILLLGGVGYTPKQQMIIKDVTAEILKEKIS